MPEGSILTDIPDVMPVGRGVRSFHLIFVLYMCYLYFTAATFYTMCTDDMHRMTPLEYRLLKCYILSQ